MLRCDDAIFAKVAIIVSATDVEQRGLGNCETAGQSATNPPPFRHPAVCQRLDLTAFVALS